MTCDEVERDDVVEDYVLGRLDEARQEAFEDHYFNCDVCLGHVRALQDARAELAARETPGWRRGTRWRQAAGVLAAAAVLVLGVRVGQELWSVDGEGPPGAKPRTDIVLPAPRAATPIELPPYTPPRLRAAPTEPQRIFRDAMTSYAAGRCAEAIPALRRALALDASFTQARFYLGVCELHGGSVDAASATLQGVIAAGESPYLEDAHFFLARARIQRGDVEGARQELRRVLALQGDRQEEAKQLLEQLR